LGGDMLHCDVQISSLIGIVLLGNSSTEFATT